MHYWGLECELGDALPHASEVIACVSESLLHILADEVTGAPDEERAAHFSFEGMQSQHLVVSLQHLKFN